MCAAQTIDTKERAPGPAGTGNAPRVSVGIPVYNGERFLAQAVDSVLHQTFTDWELIISDNASTDGTGEMCRRYAALDPRIRYHRFTENVGIAANYARVFTLARGTYFKWLASDDVCSPQFLADCVEVLDNSPDVVLVYPRSAMLDDDGNVCPDGFDLRSSWGATPGERYRQLLHEFVLNNGGTAGVYICGLMRTDVVARQTRLVGDFFGADCVLIVEMALVGEVAEAKNSYSYVRSGSSARMIKNWNLRNFMKWYNPNSSGNHFHEFVFAHRRNWEYSRAALRSNLALPARLTLAAYGLTVPLERAWRRLTVR